MGFSLCYFNDTADTFHLQLPPPFHSLPSYGTISLREPAFYPEKIRFSNGAFLSKTLGSHRPSTGCAGKAAFREGKTAVTRPREGPGLGPGTQRTDSLASRCEALARDSRRNFQTDRGKLSVGQREARRVSWPYLGRPLWRLLLQRLPSARIHR